MSNGLPGLLRISQGQLDWLARRLAGLFRSYSEDEGDSPVFYDSKVTTAAPGMLSGQLLPGDVMRRVLLISSNNAQVTFLAQQSGIGLVGIPVSSSLSPLIFTYREHKCLVTGPWWGITSVAGPVISFTEVIYHPERRANLS